MWALTRARAPPLETLNAPPQVCSVAVFPGGDRVASASTDKTVKIWDVATGKVLVSTTHSVPTLPNTLPMHSALQKITKWRAHW